MTVSETWPEYLERTKSNPAAQPEPAVVETWPDYIERTKAASGANDDEGGEKAVTGDEKETEDKAVAAKTTGRKSKATSDG